jgi:putative transferase (TIGR04331 family)
MASLASEKGARVYLSQHGSDYGDLYTSTHAYLTEYSVDGFISWGWDKHDHHPANIVPMPSPVLSKLRVRRLFARKSNKIIFASTVYAPNSAGMCMRIDADELRDSFDNLKIFLSSLNPEALKNFYYRPRPTHHSFGFDTYKQIQKLFPQIKKHTGVFDQEAACAKLIVHDNVGSTLHKSVAAKIPVLFFWRKDQILLNDYISERLEQLEKEKIYFRDPKEASNFINEISSDPLKFNYNFDAIDFYRKKYCQSSLFYFFSWIKCMLKL